VEVVHCGCDVRWQALSGEQRALPAVERHELQCDWQASLERELPTEQRFDGVIEVKAAGLELGTERVVDAIGRAVLDLVPDLEQELQIIDRAAVGGHAPVAMHWPSSQ
jgi:hypothetical protein